ncbi:MAG: co-chaperone DjlA [Arsenophonus sp.]
MRYFGKIIGIILGIMSGIHILGIIIGLIIGHAYDKISEQKIEKRDDKQNLRRQELFFISTFQVLGHLSKAKGRITEIDIKLATNIMERMQLHGDTRILAQNAFGRGKEKNFPLRGTIRKLREACFGRFDLIQIFLEIQIQAAFSDGELHNNEQKILFVIAEELGISYNQFEQFLDMMEGGRWFEHGDKYSYGSNCYQDTTQRPTLLDACKVLGVQPEDEQTKIKRAYRKLMSKNHPDKLIAKGLPPEMMEIAKQKAQSIQSAYDLIKKKRNFK